MSPTDEQAYRFGDFVLEVANRRLLRSGVPVELNARYFDALTLLVREHGQLVTKDRFFEEVWDDVVVSDSALTQCIKQIRIQLDDDAGAPRFVATVPRHGYRFVAAVEQRPAGLAGPAVAAQGFRFDTVRWAREGTAGTLGGAFAGIVGGVLYGAGLAYTPASADLGTSSVLLVLLSLSMVLGTLGGFGVGFGMSTGRALSNRSPGWTIVGAAIGGLVVGSVTKLLGVDGFNLFLGRAPTEVTGGLEGAALGAAVATGLLTVRNPGPRWRPIVATAVTTATAGVLIATAGGHLLGGSLELLARTFSESRLELDAMGRFFGELHFGRTSQIILSGLEGLLFGGFIAAAWTVVARRR